MSDDEKLTAPAFEQMDAGFRFGSRSVEFDPALGVATPVDYETATVDARLPAGVR